MEVSSADTRPISVKNALTKAAPYLPHRLRLSNSQATLGIDTLQNNSFGVDVAFSSFDGSVSTSESAPHESDVTLVSKVSVVAANTSSPDPSEACSDASSLSHDPTTFSSVFTFPKVSLLSTILRFL